MTTQSTAIDVRRAAELLLAARRAVALTGAGISTPSGIPDFRSKGSGLWERYDPMEVASLTAFRYHPERFYEWIRPLVSKMLSAEPNPAHIALARLEQVGRLIGVVTQNIDDLHQRAGSRRVIEVHGHLRAATCVSCYHKVAADESMFELVKEGKVPRCERCSGVLKPDVVLFGEQLPSEAVHEAQQLVATSDLVLVIGSSLEVTPAALFPVQALNSGARLIILNHNPTYLDERADLIFRDDVAVVLPRIVAEVIDV